MLEILEAAIPLALAALLALVSLRAIRRKTMLMKWGVGGVAALLALVAAIVGVLAVLGLTGLHARDVPSVSFDLARSNEQIQRGRDIADGFCSGCHSPDDTIPSLIGGSDIGKHFPLPLGSFVPSNLTPQGPLARWSDGEVFRAIRHSVGADGRRLFVMSLTNTGRLGDDDIKAVIAYLRSARAEGRDTGAKPDRFSLLGLMMLGAHMLPGPKPVTQSVIPAPPKAPTAQFGEYILSYQDCRACHGETLTGGVPGQIAPLGPDLSMVKVWTLDQFVATMRTGVDPNGHELGKEMPWRPIGRMDDDELRAMYQYLVEMPAT